MRFAWIGLLIGLLAPSAWAQDRQPSHCIALAQAPGLEYLQLASWTAPVPEYSVRLHYIAHASFLVQTSGGVSAVTDYTGFLGPTDLVPDVVTMNKAHETHWTALPDPEIPHVLPGWGAAPGAAADHHLTVGDMLIRNVPTDIRDGFGGRESNGNSIFVFEAEGLCIGHLGHLHQEPSDAQYAALGRLDIVMVPVDGGRTLPTAVMARVVERLRSSIVVPMHWFSDYGLGTFLTDLSDTFDVVDVDGPSFEVSLRTLPRRPTVMVLRPRYLQDE